MVGEIKKGLEDAAQTAAGALKGAGTGITKAIKERAMTSGSTGEIDELRQDAPGFNAAMQQAASQEHGVDLIQKAQKTADQTREDALKQTRPDAVPEVGPEKVAENKSSGPRASRSGSSSS